MGEAEPWTTSARTWEDNATEAYAVPTVPPRHIGLTTEVVLTACYAVGIAGNLAALVILVRTRAHRNRRHALMLRCLACNDLVALVGMLVMMEAQLRLPARLARSRAFCGLRAVWRLFGLGSGSVALVMALERWLALTRPFLYQKHVTYHVVRRAVFALWTGVLLLVMLPLFGFGLYYDPEARACARYPRATRPADIAYAYVYFTFGVLLIASILCCNLLVVRRLHQAGHASWGRVRCRTLGSASMAAASAASASLDAEGRPSASPPPRRWALVRALLRGARAARAARAAEDQPPRSLRGSLSRSRCQRAKLQHSESQDSATHEETAFAKLMGLLCVLFVLCWLPQMMAIPLTQLWPSWPAGQKFSRLADFSLLLHFTLDPFVYVLQSCTRRHGKAKSRVDGHPMGAVGHALAGAAEAASASAAPAWPHGPHGPHPYAPTQCFVRKLGASLRLTLCPRPCPPCGGRGHDRERQRQGEPASALLHGSIAL